MKVVVQVLRQQMACFSWGHLQFCVEIFFIFHLYIIIWGTELGVLGGMCFVLGVGFFVCLFVWGLFAIGVGGDGWCFVGFLPLV